MTGKRTKSPKSEGFSVETRYVVLNFLGRVPTGDSLSSSLGSSTGRSLPSDDSRSPTKSTGSGNGTLSKQALKTLPDINMVDKYHESQMDSVGSRKLSEHHADVLNEAATDGVTKRTSPVTRETTVKTGAWSARPSSIPLPSRRSPGRSVDRSRLPVYGVRSVGTLVGASEARVENAGMGTAGIRSEATGIAGRRNYNQRATRTLENAAAALGGMEEEAGESELGGVPRSKREVSDGGVLLTAEKPESESSSSTPDNSPSIACSIRSYTSSTSVIDLPTAEVEMLVQRNALPPFVLPLREELAGELSQLEQLMPLPRAMTPQSEVAFYLAQIGDRVQEEYSSQLCDTTVRVLEIPRQQVTYSIYHQIAEELISASSGWTKVALLLLLSQKLAFAMLSRGDRNLSELADYTAHMIEDSAADFIVESGGWNAVRDIASTPDIADPMTTSPMFTPNLPGVDEHDHLDSIDEVEDTLSQADSAICTDFTPETSAPIVPQTRDISMDSISSSVWGDTATPGGATSSSNQPTGGTTGSDAHVVQDEIRLLRQVSTQLSQEAEGRREDNLRWRRFQVFLISTVTAIVAAYIAYKKLLR